MNKYSISFEISGPAAMWSRPDTGTTPISYPAPPWSAAKGLFESMSRLKNTIIIPTAVEICAPIIYHDYTTNYIGPLRKRESLTKGNPFQYRATVLINVCYRLYARIEELEYIPKTLLEASKLSGFNRLHYSQERFHRRLLRGQYYDIPSLGWREFIPNYVGPFRNYTEVQTSINEIVPSFLYSVFDPKTNLLSPKFVQSETGRKIVKGRLEYAE